MSNPAIRTVVTLGAALALIQGTLHRHRGS